MNFDIATQLAIIAEEESAAIYQFTLLTLGALAVLISLLLVVTVNQKMVKSIGFGVLLVAASILAHATVPKPKVDAWPEGVSNDGSRFDTNEWRFVEFKWKLRESYPENIQLTFWRMPKGLPGDWSALGEEPSGSLSRRFYSGTSELPDNPTNYIYKVTSGYVPPELPSIALVSTTASNVTIKVSCVTNYIGHSAKWEARRQMYLNTRLPIWGPWTDLGQLVIFNETETNRVVEGSFVNGRRNTEIRLRMNISDEGTNGVRP